MLIPIGHEDQRVTRLPWVTILLVLANVAVFLLTNQLVQQQAAFPRTAVVFGQKHLEMRAHLGRLGCAQLEGHPPVRVDHGIPGVLHVGGSRNAALGSLRQAQAGGGEPETQ